MSAPSPDERRPRKDPALFAGRIAEYGGCALTFFAGLMLVAMLPEQRHPWRINSLMMLAFPLTLLATGLTLLVAAGPVRKASKSWTIVTLMLAIGIAGVFGYGSAKNVDFVIRYRRTDAGNLVLLALLVVISGLALLLGVYSLRSLRFPDRRLHKRGFEPLMPVAVERTPDA